MDEARIADKIYNNEQEFYMALYERYKDGLKELSEVINEPVTITDLQISLDFCKAYKNTKNFIVSDLTDEKLSLAVKQLNIYHAGAFGICIFFGDEAEKLKAKAKEILKDNVYSIGRTVTALENRINDISERVLDTASMGEIDELTEQLNETMHLQEFIGDLYAVERFYRGISEQYNGLVHGNRINIDDTYKIVKALEREKIDVKKIDEQFYENLKQRLYRLLKLNDLNLYRTLKSEECSKSKWKSICIKTLILSEQEKKEDYLVNIFDVIASSKSSEYFYT